MVATNNVSQELFGLCGMDWLPYLEDRIHSTIHVGNVAVGVTVHVDEEKDAAKVVFSPALVIPPERRCAFLKWLYTAPDPLWADFEIDKKDGEVMVLAGTQSDEGAIASAIRLYSLFLEVNIEVLVAFVR